MNDLNFQLTALPGNLDCFIQPKLSQVCNIFIIPFGAPLPTDWTNESDFIDVIDNTNSTNQYGKQLFGVGEVPKAETIVTSMGNSRKVLGYRKQLNFEVQIGIASVYSLLQHMQLGFTSFRFWFGTIGGRLIGGEEGMIPELVSVDFPSEGTNESIEKAVIKIEWTDSSEPGRADMEGLITVPGPALLVSDDTGTVISDDSGQTIGIY